MILQLVKDMIYIFVKRLPILVLIAFIALAPVTANVVNAQTVRWIDIQDVFNNPDTDCSDNSCIYQNNDGIYLRVFGGQTRTLYEFNELYAPANGSFSIEEVIPISSFGGVNIFLRNDTGGQIGLVQYFSGGATNVTDTFNTGNFAGFETDNGSGSSVAITDLKINIVVNGVEILKLPPNAPLNIDVFGSTTPATIFSGVVSGVQDTSGTFAPLYALVGVPVSFVIGRGVLLFIRSSV